MKSVRLLDLKLTNFKGCRSFTLETHGQNCNIYGDNGTYKTTLFDAFSYLLTDKDSQGKTDFGIKTLDQAGDELHGLQHEVEAKLDLGDRTITLKKVYEEKWTKKRGSITPEFTGHETSYFADGVPIKKNEYAAIINGIASEEMLKLLTNPAYFNEHMPALAGQPAWKRRRDILVEVCGDVSDQEVIASDVNLAKLPEILKGRKLDDHRKVIAARRAELNKEIEKIPTRIDEVMRGLPDITGLNENDLQAEIDGRKSLLKTMREALVQMESGGEMAQKKNDLANIVAELQTLRNEHQDIVDSLLDGKRKSLEQLESKYRKLSGQIADLMANVTNNSRRIASLSNTNAQLRTKWFDTNDQALEFSQETICPACGQDIPEEKLAETREKARAQFNQEKAEKLQAINTEGAANKAEITRLEEENAGYQKQIDSLNAEAEGLEEKVAKLQAEVNAIRGESTVEKTPVYAQKLQEKADMEAAMANLQEGSSEAIREAQMEIDMTETDIKALERSLAELKRYEDGQARVNELKAQEKQLAAEYGKLEGELYLTEQFIRSKVALLEEKINSRFKYARFKLFETQVNGGVVETCQTLYNGVPYGSGLNHGGCVTVGLDIINTLSEHYGFSAPIFIDFRESVTKLPETMAQTISLIVSEPDKKLRVEIEGKENKEVA